MHEHMINTLTHSFSEINAGITRYNADEEYAKFNGFMIKLMARLFPGMFKKQVHKWLVNFKIHAEKSL